MNPKHVYMDSRLQAGLKTQTAVGLASLASSCQPGGKVRPQETDLVKRERPRQAVERSGRQATIHYRSSESPPLLFQRAPSGRLESSRGALTSGLSAAVSHDRPLDGSVKPRNPEFSLPKGGRIGARS